MRKTKLLFLLLIVVLLCVCASCTPKVERIYGVGDIWSNDSVEIKLNTSEYIVNDIESTVTLELNFTINATGEYQIKEDALYVYTSLDEKNFTITERNEKLNGFNILNKSISGEIHYTFCFELPFDNFMDGNNKVIDGSWGIRCFIDPASFYVVLDM